MSISREMLVALCVGVVLISGSLFVNASNTTVEGEVTASANQAPVRQYIEPTDTNENGISDWTEQLLADREVILSELDPAEPYKIPNTLTAQFSVQFFKDYLTAKGLGSLEENKEALVKQTAASIEKEATDYLFTLADIEITEGNSVEELHAYGNDIASIISYSSATVELDEISIFERSLSNNNPDQLKGLDPIIESYQYYLDETLKTPVPSDLIQQHLDIINVYNAILHDLQAMRNVYTDPLLGLLRLKRYDQDIEGMVYAYFNLDLSLRRAGISYQDDEPGFIFSQLGEIKKLLNSQ